MSRIVRRSAAMSRVARGGLVLTLGVALLGGAGGGVVSAQGNLATDDCSMLLGPGASAVEPDADGLTGCRFASMPGDGYQPFGVSVVDEWSVVDDPTGDPVTPAGAPATSRDTVPDITRVIWGTGTFTKALARAVAKTHKAGSAGTAYGAKGVPKTGAKLVIFHVDLAEPMTTRSPGWTELVGIGGDPNHKAAGEWPAGTGHLFEPWNGISILNQGGFFSNGAFGVGTTDLARRGKNGAIQYYNRPSSTGLFVEDGGFTGWVSTADAGGWMRLWVQGVQPTGEGDQKESVVDLVGRPFDTDLLPVDGVVRSPGACVSGVLARNVPVGDEMIDRALLITTVTDGASLLSDPLTEATDPAVLPRFISGAPTRLVRRLVREGHQYLIPVSGGKALRTIGYQALGANDWDGDGDIDADDEALAKLWDAALDAARTRTGIDQVEVDGRPGPLFGDPDCGRLPVEPCSLLATDAVAEAAGVEPDSLVIRSGFSPDGSLRSCTAALPGEQQPIAGVNISDLFLTQDAFDENAASLASDPSCEQEPSGLSDGHSSTYIFCEPGNVGVYRRSPDGAGLYAYDRGVASDLAVRQALAEAIDRSLVSGLPDPGADPGA